MTEGKEVNLKETANPILMQVHYFKILQKYGIYHYFKVHGTGDQIKRNGYQEVINFLNPDPIIRTEQVSENNVLTGTWCTFKVGILISKQDWDEA